MRTAVLESVLSFVIAPGAIALIDAIPAGAVAANGQSLTVRKGDGGDILNPWANNNVTGGLRILSSSTHGNRQNINLEAIAGVTMPLMGDVPNHVFANDTLQVSQYGSAVVGDIEQNIIPIWYPRVEGLNANLLTKHEVIAYRANGLEQGKENIALRIPVVTLATGQWSAGVPLSTLTGYSFKANRYYAVRGMSVTARCCAIAFRSTENAGVRTAVPGEPNNPRMTSRFFMDLSEEFGRATVPIFNGSSLADASVEVACNQAGGGATFIVTLHATLLNIDFDPANLV